MISTTLVADASALAHANGQDLATALTLARTEIASAITAVLTAAYQWSAALSVLDDPSTLRSVLDELAAQRYQHPPAVARAVGNAIASLEAYLAVEAPTSTDHPARRAVEL